MQLNSTQYGERLPDGSVRKPEVSALSGRPLVPGDPRITLGRFIIGVTASEWHNMSKAERVAMKAEWEQALSTVPEPEPLAQAGPDYDAMTVQELRQLAEGRGVDLSGRTRKEDIVQALRAEDVRARFAETPAGEES